MFKLGGQPSTSRESVLQVARPKLISLAQRRWVHLFPKRNWPNSLSEIACILLYLLNLGCTCTFYYYRFFGDTPPILQQFLERLGYEVRTNKFAFSQAQWYTQHTHISIFYFWVDTICIFYPHRSGVLPICVMI